MDLWWDRTSLKGMYDEGIYDEEKLMVVGEQKETEKRALHKIYSLRTFCQGTIPFN